MTRSTRGLFPKRPMAFRTRHIDVKIVQHRARALVIEILRLPILRVAGAARRIQTAEVAGRMASIAVQRVMKLGQIEPAAPRVIEIRQRRFAVARVAIVVDPVLMAFGAIFVRVRTGAHHVRRGVVATGATLLLVTIRTFQSKQLRVVPVVKRYRQLFACVVKISGLRVQRRMLQANEVCVVARYRCGRSGFAFGMTFAARGFTCPLAMTPQTLPVIRAAQTRLPQI